MLMMWPDRCWRITGRPHDEGGAPEIGRELTLKSGGGQFLEIAEEAEARIVDQDIDAAKLLQCLLDSYLGLGFVGDVELDEGEVLAAATAKSLAHFVTIPASGDTRSPTLRAALAIPAPIPLPAPVMNHALLIIL